MIQINFTLYYFYKKKMLKENKNKIEKVIDMLRLANGLNYRIKYKGMKKTKLVNENDLTELEKKYCENFKKSFLNKKRSNSNSSNNINSWKNKTIEKDKNDYESSSSIERMERYYKKNEEKISNNKEIKTKYFEREGVLDDDSPLKIMNVGKIKNDNSLYCMVRWKQTKDGIRILDSLVATKRMRKANPMLLIDYYESKIKFLDDL